MGAQSSRETRHLIQGGGECSTAANSNNNTKKRTQKTVSNRTVIGRSETTIWSRKFLVDDRFSMQKPAIEGKNLYEDRHIPRQVEKDRWARSQPTWKRPKDFITGDEKVRLFGDKVNRHSVRQGQVGDCYFMTALSATAEHPKQLKQIMPANAYRTSDGKYHGVFHCRFWTLGEWIDVYTDDLLPYNEDARCVFGGHSKESNVVWVALMEKALARLCGGYASIGGDQAAAYVLLTGGVVEEAKILKDENEDVKLFKRIRRAIDCRSAVLTGIDEKEAGNRLLQGLVANHAYEVTAATKIKHDKTKQYLLRIRNPWGETNKVRPANENGEWKGRWSYNSSEWNAVGKRLQKKFDVKYDEDGEFWICMQDFHNIFGHIYFADKIPNFDENGFRKKDKLNQVINILGEWYGETAAGHDIKAKFKNPRYLLTIPSKGSPRDDRTAVVFQLVQQYDNAVSQTKETLKQLFCRLDIFRIEKKKKTVDSRLQLSLTELTNPSDYVSGRFITYRYKLSPGTYILVPNYMRNNQPVSDGRKFCVRIFSGTSLLKCRQIEKSLVAMVGKPFAPRQNISQNSPPAESIDHEMDVTHSVSVIGEWSGETAAGPEDNGRMKNPKFILTVPGILNRKRKVLFQLRHCRDGDRELHCRLDVFKINASLKRNKQRWILLHQLTNDETFHGGVEVPYQYELAPGEYMLLPNCSKRENFDCAFSVRILSSVPIKCRRLTEPTSVFVQKADDLLRHGDQQHNLDKAAFVFDEWIRDKTAGGQVNHPTFDRNPQYELTVSGTTSQPVLVDLLQETVEPIYAIGYHIIRIEASQRLPMNRDTLRSLNDQRVSTIRGGMHALCDGLESSDYYLLQPGRYAVLVYADKPSDEKKFTLLVKSLQNSKIKLNKP